jgi:peptidoglycan/LPS O-acetylase OafA/YrhL
MGLWVYARACQSKDKRDKRGYRKLFIAALLYALIANMAGLPWLHLAAGCFISFFGERLSDMENTGKPQHMIFSLWVNTVLCRLGIISYGVYVGHFAVRHFLEVSGLGQSVRQWAGGGAIGLLSHFIILLLLSGLLAEVLHRGIEKPILKWVKKWGKQDKQVVSL